MVLTPNGASCGNCEQEQADRPTQSDACCGGHVAVSDSTGLQNLCFGNVAAVSPNECTQHAPRSIQRYIGTASCWVPQQRRKMLAKWCWNNWPSLSLFLIATFNVYTSLPTKPYHKGWYGDTRICLTLWNLQKQAISSDTNRGMLSETSCSGSRLILLPKYVSVLPQAGIHCQEWFSCN